MEMVKYCVFLTGATGPSGAGTVPADCQKRGCTGALIRSPLRTECSRFKAHPDTGSAKLRASTVTFPACLLAQDFGSSGSGILAAALSSVDGKIPTASLHANPMDKVRQMSLELFGLEFPGPVKAGTLVEMPCR